MTRPRPVLTPTRARWAWSLVSLALVLTGVVVFLSPVARLRGFALGLALLALVTLGLGRLHVREMQRLRRDRHALRRKAARLNEAREHLVVERDYLDAVVDLLDVGLVACDAAGRITRYNPAARKLLRLSDAAIAGLAAEGMPLGLALKGESLRGEDRKLGAPEQDTFRIVRFHGDPLRGPDGTIRGAMVTVSDVTQNRRTEEALRALARHARELERVNEDLRRTGSA